jgi:hypothetical protein
MYSVGVSDLQITKLSDEFGQYTILLRRDLRPCAAMPFHAL